MSRNSVARVQLEKSLIQAQQEEIRKWLEDCFETQFDSSKSLIDHLKTGVILCQLMNLIHPKSISFFNKAPKSKMPALENIEVFLDAARAYGVKSSFSGVDMVEHGAIKHVLNCLKELAELATKKGFQPSFTSQTDALSIQLEELSKQESSGSSENLLNQLNSTQTLNNSNNQPKNEEFPQISVTNHIENHQENQSKEQQEKIEIIEQIVEPIIEPEVLIDDELDNQSTNQNSTEENQSTEPNQSNLDSNQLDQSTSFNSTSNDNHSTSTIENQSKESSNQQQIQSNSNQLSVVSISSQNQPIESQQQHQQSSNDKVSLI